MELIDIDLIDFPDFRPREEDEVLFQKLCSMVRQYGQVRSVTVMQCPLNTVDLRRFICIEGRNIIQACKAASIPLIWAQNVGVYDSVKSREISLMLNELEFRTDFVSVAEMVKVVVKATSIANASTHSMFTAREVQKFMRILNFNWEEFDRAKQSGKISLFEEHMIKDEESPEVMSDDELDNLAISEQYKQLENGLANKENAVDDEQPDTGSDQLPDTSGTPSGESEHGGTVRGSETGAQPLEHNWTPRQVAQGVPISGGLFS
jgi:hypothetical protein